MKREPPRSAGVRRGPFSLKSRIFIRFWPQEWSGWVRTGHRIHLVFVSGQTVDSLSISSQIDVFASDWNFGQPGLDLTETVDTSSEAALDVTIRNQTQI